MTYHAIPLLLLLAATGCGAMHDSIARANDGVYKGGAKSRKKVAGWIYSENGQPLAPAPDAQRFCYNVRSDILCYDQPRVGMEGTIVGAQAPGALAQGYGNGNGNVQPQIPRSRYNGLQTNPVEDYTASPRGYRSSSDVAGALADDRDSTFVPLAPSVAGTSAGYSSSSTSSEYYGDAPQTLIDR